MTEHTSEPWRYEIWNGLHHTVVDADGETVAFQVSTGEKAQRIVGCVNACEGLNPKAVPRLHNRLKDLIERLDAAAKACHEAGMSDFFVGWLRACVEDARTAIAAAKDGGN